MLARRTTRSKGTTNNSSRSKRNNFIIWMGHGIFRFFLLASVGYAAKSALFLVVLLQQRRLLLSSSPISFGPRHHHDDDDISPINSRLLRPSSFCRQERFDRSLQFFSEQNRGQRDRSAATNERRRGRRDVPRRKKALKER